MGGAISSIVPRFEKLISKKQEQKSHSTETHKQTLELSLFIFIIFTNFKQVTIFAEYIHMLICDIFSCLGVRLSSHIFKLYKL